MSRNVLICAAIGAGLGALVGTVKHFVSDVSPVDTFLASPDGKSFFAIRRHPEATTLAKALITLREYMTRTGPSEENDYLMSAFLSNLNAFSLMLFLGCRERNIALAEMLVARTNARLDELLSRLPASLVELGAKQFAVFKRSSETILSAMHCAVDGIT